MISAAGIHNIPMAAYLADPCPAPSLSSSCGHTLLVRSPKHAWARHPRLGNAEQEEVSAANIGSVAHDILLGGEGKIAVLHFPDWRTNASKEARDEARSQGLTPILEHQMPPVHAMVESARDFAAHSDDIAGIFDRGKSEQTLIWKEGEVWCRARPDWLTDDRDVMLHVKTTQASARPEQFIRGVMASMGYGFSLRFYARALAAVCDGTEKTKHLILVIEQDAPHGCSLISLVPAKAAIEDARVQTAITRWGECLAADRWPAYDTRVHYAEPTAWELAEEGNS